MNATVRQVTYETWVRKLGPEPMVAEFTLPASSETSVVPISSFVAVALSEAIDGYLVTESATQPSPFDAGWSATVPTQVIAGGLGLRTFYAWVQDIDGQIGGPLSAICSVLGSTITTLAGDLITTGAGDPVVTL